MEKNFSNINEDDKIKAEALRAITGEDTNIDPTGWIEIKKTDLSYDGTLYPNDYRFSIKPANAGLLKYFSTLDESNPMAVQDALIYVIANHVRILSNKKFIKPVDVIYEHDRLLFTLLVHQYSGSPSKLIINGRTPSNLEQNIEVTPQSLIFSTITEKGLSYLNQKTGVFEVKTGSYGVLNYKPLTVTQSMDLTQFVYKESQEGRTIESFFLSVAPFFINDTNASNPSEIYKLYFAKTQDQKFVSTLITIRNHIDIELLLEFNAIDEKTKQPFRSPVSSLKGIKDIFTFSDSASELQ